MAATARGSSGLVLVPGQLQPDELVERHVVVQGLDDEVAVVVGGRPVGVALVAAAVGVAGDVQPVPAPALAVVGAGEEPVHEGLVGGVRVRGLDERLDLVRRRRQPGQVERDAADQRAGVRGRVPASDPWPPARRG